MQRVSHVCLRLVLGSHVHEQLLDVPVEHRPKVSIYLQRENGLVMTGTLDLSSATRACIGKMSLQSRLVLSHGARTA